MTGWRVDEWIDSKWTVGDWVVRDMDGPHLEPPRKKRQPKP